MERELKRKISITLEPALVKWLDGEVERKTFASRSHATQVALLQLKQTLTSLPPEVKSALVHVTPNTTIIPDVREDRYYVISGSLLKKLLENQFGGE